MKSKYSNIEEIYALNTIKNYYIENITFNKLVNDSKNTFINLNDDINNSNNYCSNLIVDNVNNNYCEKIKSIVLKYKINNFYIVDENKLSELKNINNINETFKDYINYLDNTLDKDDNKLYLLGEFIISSDIYSYAYIPIKI